MGRLRRRLSSAESPSGGRFGAGQRRPGAESVRSAASDLGAVPWRILRGITSPVARVGIVTGVGVVGMLSLGEFVVLALLGGSRVMLIGNLLAERGAGRYQPLAGALTTVLVLTLVCGALVLAVVVGTAVAVAARRSPLLRAVGRITTALRVATPEIVIATGLTALIPAVGLNLGFQSMLIAHVAYLTCYVILIVGASALLVLAFSLDDVALSLALRGPTDTTLPVYLYSVVQRRATPSIHAVGTLVVLTGAALFLAAFAIHNMLSDRARND